MFMHCSVSIKFVVLEALLSFYYVPCPRKYTEWLRKWILESKKSRFEERTKELRKKEGGREEEGKKEGKGRERKERKERKGRKKNLGLNWCSTCVCLGK